MRARAWLTLAAISVTSTLPHDAAGQIPDPTVVTDASREILSTGVVGAMLILVVLLWLATVRVWRQDLAAAATRADAALAAKHAELLAERESHQKTRDAYLSEIRDLRRVYEPLDEIRMAIARLSVGERDPGIRLTAIERGRA